MNRNYYASPYLIDGKKRRFDGLMNGPGLSVSLAFVMLFLRSKRIEYGDL